LKEAPSDLNIHFVYKFIENIGKGSFGDVKLAQLKANPLQNVAIKIIPKQKVKMNILLFRELKTLINLDHPNIIKFYEVF